jgi:hypothetical protein
MGLKNSKTNNDRETERQYQSASIHILQNKSKGWIIGSSIFNIVQELYSLDNSFDPALLPMTETHAGTYIAFQFQNFQQ